MNTIRLLLLTLFIAAMPIKGLAYTSGQIVTFNNLWFKVISGTDRTLAFIGKNGAAGNEITLPNPVDAGIEGKFKITSVEYVSGYDCSGMTKITLPETVTRFGSFCFTWSNLTELHIPSSVKDIDNSAFCCLSNAPKYTVASGNKNFETDSNGALYLKGKKKLYSVPSNVPLQPGGEYHINQQVETICIGAILRTKNLKVLVFPKDLKSIAMGMFTIAPTGSIEAFEVAPGGSTQFSARSGVLFKGKELVLYPQGKHDTYYRVPDDITKIATYAISDNSKLENIDLNNVKTLEGSAIYNAQKLTSITIPRDIKKYGTVPGEGLKEGCFESCPNVEKYLLAPGNGDFYIDNGVLLSKDKTILYSYPPKKQGTTYNIPTTVTKIGMHAFHGAQYITSIFIPANVERIDSEAFRDLRELTTVTFDPNSKVSDIFSSAFRGCGKLKETYTIKKENLDETNKNLGSSEEKVEVYKKSLQNILEQEKKQQELLVSLKKFENKYNKTLQVIDNVSQMGRSISKYMLANISNIASLNFNKITGRTEKIEWSNEDDDKYAVYLVGKERKIAFEQLSGGEQVSVAIAIRGTMTEYFTNSRFMILDEPTNNLDTERKKLLAEYMGEILKNLDQSIIVTHDDTFREMAEKIIEL